MPIAFVLYETPVLFNDDSLSEGETVFNDLVISASTTKDITNLLDPVIITFDMGEKVFEEPQIPDWFPGGVLDVSSKMSPFHSDRKPPKYRR